MASQRDGPSAGRREHPLRHKISILPPSSWAKIDLTDLFNMDDYYNANITPTSAHSGLRLSYTAPWHSPQHDATAVITPDSPASSTWSLATVTQLLDDMPTPTPTPMPAPPPVYTDPDFRFAHADLKPPPLYLHPFYSRSGIAPVELETRPSTAPPVAVHDWYFKPLPRLPQFEDGDEDKTATDPGASADGHMDRTRSRLKLKALLRVVMWSRSAVASRSTDRRPES